MDIPSPTKGYSKLRSRSQCKSRPLRRRPRRLSVDHLERRDLLATSVVGDFNGDGADDLAVGVPYESVGSIAGAGAVNVIYGQTGTGLVSTGNQFWHQDISGVLDVAEVDDHFGAALTAGDFNGDGFDDLAIGIPNEDVNGFEDGGAAQVLFGSATGLTSTRNQFVHQNTSGVKDELHANDRFGSALATGDFNNDGRKDLIVGVPGEANSRGAVNVVFGHRTEGLVGTQNRFYSGDAVNDRFGFAVAAGDLNCDDSDDLVIGAPGTSLAAPGSEEGAIYVFYTAPHFGAEIYHQDSYSVILDVAEPGDRFGASLAMGDFRGDGKEDIAIGVPGEDIGDVIDAGAVQILQGFGGAICGVGPGQNQFWHQNTDGILDVAEEGDFFGASLQAGDFNGDGKLDLAIGVPGESFGSGIDAVIEAGAVNVIYSSSAGLTANGNQFWHQNTSGILGTIEAGDAFGLSLAVGDFNNDGRVDLAVGSPGEQVAGVPRAGSVTVIYASASGLTSTGNQVWNQNTSGILDAAEDDEYFGVALLGGSTLAGVLLGIPF